MPGSIQTAVRPDPLEDHSGGDNGVPSGYSRQVGERLRVIRRQKHFSLQDVENTSSNEFKASVLGAYERGERSISVPRLQRLARFYAVPVDQLLPQDDGPGFERDDTPRSREVGSVRIDLQALERMDAPEAATLKRFMSMIQLQRQDFNGRVITIRRDDLRAIAAILAVSFETVTDRLTQADLIVEV